MNRKFIMLAMKEIRKINQERCILRGPQTPFPSFGLAIGWFLVRGMARRHHRCRRTWVSLLRFSDLANESSVVAVVRWEWSCQGWTVSLTNFSTMPAQIGCVQCPTEKQNELVSFFSSNSENSLMITSLFWRRLSSILIGTMWRVTANAIVRRMILSRENILFYSQVAISVESSAVTMESQHLRWHILSPSFTRIQLMKRLIPLAPIFPSGSIRGSMCLEHTRSCVFISCFSHQFRHGSNKSRLFHLCWSRTYGCACCRCL